MGSCWPGPRVVPSTYQTGELRKSADMSASEARPRSSRFYVISKIQEKHGSYCNLNATKFQVSKTPRGREIMRLKQKIPRLLKHMFALGRKREDIVKKSNCTGRH